MNKLFRLFDCLDKLTFLVWCEHEFDELYGKKSNTKGLSRVAEMLENALGEIIIFGILAYGIYKGWVVMPEPYLGDGYSFDNFGKAD